MAKKSINVKNQKCIHCLRIPAEITEDHVIPRSWYSLQSKNNFKPRAPSCFPCNNELGSKEKFLSHVLWMCMPESHPFRKEKTQEVYRACGMELDGRPLLGLDDNERIIRLKYAKKLLDSTVSASQVDENRFMPGFGFHPGYPKEIQRATFLDSSLLFQVASKVIRGLEYIQKKQNRYIESPYKLEVCFPRNPQSDSLAALREICPVFSDGTNTIQRGAETIKPLEPIYIIRLWNHWEIWGVIMHEDRIKELSKNV